MTIDRFLIRGIRFLTLVLTIWIVYLFCPLFSIYLLSSSFIFSSLSDDKKIVMSYEIFIFFLVFIYTHLRVQREVNIRGQQNAAQNYKRFEFQCGIHLLLFHVWDQSFFTAWRSFFLCSEILYSKLLKNNDVKENEQNRKYISKPLFIWTACQLEINLQILF